MNNELYKEIVRLGWRVRPELLQLSIPPHWATGENMQTPHRKIQPQPGIEPRILLMLEEWTWNISYSGIGIWHIPPSVNSVLLTETLYALAVTFGNGFSSWSVSTDTLSSFELNVTRIGQLKPFNCILIYPPSGHIYIYIKFPISQVWHLLMFSLWQDGRTSPF